MARSRKPAAGVKPTANPLPPTPPVITPTIPPAGDKGGANSLLSKLSAKAKTPSPTEAAKKKTDRPTIRLEDNNAEIFDRLASSDQILKLAEAGKKEAKSAADDIVRREWCVMALNRGSKPENPKVMTTHANANYVVKHIKKVSLAQPVEKLLSDNGFSEDSIQTIKKVVKEKEHLGLKRFTDLMSDEASAAQKAAAEKVINLVMENLTPEELEIVLDKSIETTIGEEWQNVAITTAIKEGNGDDGVALQKLTDLFGIMQPQFVFSQFVYTGDLSQALGSLSNRPAEAPAAARKSSDGKYIYQPVAGNKLELYLVKPDGNELLGVKTCTNAGHVDASIKKFEKDKSALNDFLATCAGSKKN